MNTKPEASTATNDGELNIFTVNGPSIGFPY